jgi:hypothetical protein
MTKARSIYTVDFCRGNATSSIEVELMKGNETISLNHCNIAYCSEVLSQKEIKTIIEILETKKELMLKECDFPSVYGEMLDDLITAYEGRYDKRAKKAKKRKLGFSVSGGKLEEILGEYFKMKDVHIYSIDVGNNRDNAAWISLKESDDCYLVLSFREVEEDE